MKLTDKLRLAILELAAREDVRSISCPYDDAELWHGLVREQLKRSQLPSVQLQRTYCLCGPDSGLHDLPIAEWGGQVHIPFEGMCDGDLVILPPWRKFDVTRLTGNGVLNHAIGKCCNHVMVSVDYGELANVTRRQIGEKFLYSSNRPPADCNPFYGNT